MKNSRVWQILAAALLVALGMVVLAGWWLLRRPLPRLDGTVAVPGLKGEVVVDRDLWGIPWIQARSPEDLALAQGYVVAQDRLWQMDLLRRAAAGELAEIFGKRAFVFDKENRTLGLRQAAEDSARRMDAETRLIVEAYARGVNRYIQERRGRLPIEFTLLRYTPRPWTAADTFLISAYMWKTLTTTWKAKLNRAWVTERVGPERARELFVVNSPLDHIIVGGAAMPPSGSSPTPRTPPGIKSRISIARADWSEPSWLAARGFLEGLETDNAESIGSNNWVVNGVHTASGKPLLANDTHLGFTVPAIWYLVHLSAPGWNVAGFSLPGTPMVVIGHNERIAWGFTNSNADVQDLYIETFNPANPIEYQADGKWVTADVRREVIHVKGQADELLDVLLTRHGPVVARDPSDSHRAYALRWTATEPGGLAFAYPLIGRARNWEEFQRVLRQITGPGQNAIYADVDGNIGYTMAAWIPLRASGQGQVPCPGDTDAFEWKGYIPFDELPRTLNPSGGVLATANARTVGPGYKYYLSQRWAGPSRTDRIYSVLAGRRGLRPSDFNSIQNDIVSLPDHFLAGELERAMHSGGPQPNDPRAIKLIAGLKDWDARATADSVETSFVEFTRHALMKRILAPYLGEDTTPYELWEPESVYNDVWWRDKVFLENVLRSRPAAWLPQPYRDYDELLMAAADQAVQGLEKTAGSAQTARWNWGRLHPIEMLHPLGQDGILKNIFSIGPYDGTGSVDTVKAIGHGHGPAMRFVADLSNLDNSLMEIPTGESGQYASPHYRDQFPEWYEGRGIPAPFSAVAEERVSVHRLRLVPR